MNRTVSFLSFKNILRVNKTTSIRQGSPEINYPKSQLDRTICNSDLGDIACCN